jgi:hypothetical protein
MYSGSKETLAGFTGKISITQFLASHNLAFRGRRETISFHSAQNSGHFIHFVKLLSKYDPILREHFRRIP